MGAYPQKVAKPSLRHIIHPLGKGCGWRPVRAFRLSHHAAIEPGSRVRQLTWMYRIDRIRARRRLPLPWWERAGVRGLPNVTHPRRSTIHSLGKGCGLSPVKARRLSRHSALEPASRVRQLTWMHRIDRIRIPDRDPAYLVPEDGLCSTRVEIAPSPLVGEGWGEGEFPNVTHPRQNSFRPASSPRRSFR